MNGWNWPGGIALAISLLALVLSWMAYRQRIKYHPQPRLVVDWERGALKHYGVPVRQVAIMNFGDAIARDLVVVLPNSARGDGRWEKRNELSPGDTWWVMAPMVSGTDMVRAILLSQRCRLPGLLRRIPSWWTPERDSCASAARPRTAGECQRDGERVTSVTRFLA